MTLAGLYCLSSFHFFLSLPFLLFLLWRGWGQGPYAPSPPPPIYSLLVGSVQLISPSFLFFFLFFPSLYLLFSFFLSLSFLLLILLMGGGGGGGGGQPPSLSLYLLPPPPPPRQRYFLRVRVRVKSRPLFLKKAPICAAEKTDAPHPPPPPASGSAPGTMGLGPAHDSTAPDT